MKSQNESITEEKLNKMDVARYLLPDPGPEVVGDLIQEVRRLRTALADIEWRYDHGEIEAACGGETALFVREKVLNRRKFIDDLHKQRATESSEDCT